ncbi:MAG: family hydrolase, partial [Chloroflexi bacterium]|nr:family hydrolase [Chloroflexota bacterium]
RLLRQQELPGARTAARVNLGISIIQGFPFVRNGLRRLLGRNIADPLIALPNIVTLTLSGNPFGLTIAEAGAVRLLTATQALRSAWQRYEDRTETSPEALPGAMIHLEAGERAPLDADVVEGTGTAMGFDGLPLAVVPGARVPAGARLFGGPFTLSLRGYSPFSPQARPAPATPSLYDRYLNAISIASLAYAALTAVVTRSLIRTIEALVLVNARTALIGADAADLGAEARITRAGVTIANTRPERSARLPDVLLVHTPRVLTDGFEISGFAPIEEGQDVTELSDLAAEVAAAAGWPWGGAFRPSHGVLTEDGRFDGRVATARIRGMPYSLGPTDPDDVVPLSLRVLGPGEILLVLRESTKERPLAVAVMRPHLAAGVTELVEACKRDGVDLAVLRAGDLAVAREISSRAEVHLLDDGPALNIIFRWQLDGAVVAFLSDSADAAPEFAACDQSIGLSSGRSSRFPARVDLLAPDLGAVASIVEAAARREVAIRDAVAMGAIGNVFGAVSGLRRRTTLRRTQIPVYVTSLGAMTDQWLRLRGGERPQSVLTGVAEPRPWRWGRMSEDEVLQALETTADGLTTAEAQKHRRVERIVSTRASLWTGILSELTSPLTGVYAAGAALSLVAAAPADVAIIAATMAVNVGLAVWQERRTGQAAKAVERLSGPTARVRRDDVAVTVPANDLVTGDILLLVAGDRVAADARLLAARGLEVDEAALTGESLPVPKMTESGTEFNRVVLEGSDVLAGEGRAVVFAVGRDTLLGATASALATDASGQSPLGARLAKLLSQMLPVAVGGSLLAVLPGLLRRQPISTQLAIGVSLFLAAVPEGVPLLARFAAKVVARRLAGRGALVHRVAAVEALGRVDVVAADKTGTLTEGRLSLRLVVGMEEEARLPGPLTADL